MPRARLAPVAPLAGALAALALAAPARAELPPPFAYNYGEIESARTAALGGATRATASSATALYQAPSGMVTTRVYHIEALGQITPEVGRQAYGGSIVDSVTGRLAGGLGVVAGAVDPEGLDRSFLDARLALAFPLTERFAVGLTGRYAKISQTGLGPFGDSKVSGGLVDPEEGRSPLVDTFSFDAGLTLRMSDALSASLVGQNLSYPNNGLLPTTLAGGLAYGSSNFTLEVDALADFNSYEATSGRFMLGGEYLVGQHVPLRLGYRYDQGASLHSLSGGLGYIGNEFSIEASLRRSLSEEGATMVVFGLAYFLESTGFTRAPSD
jgi:hypothetical protein